MRCESTWIIFLQNVSGMIDWLGTRRNFAIGKLFVVVGFATTLKTKNIYCKNFKITAKKKIIKAC